MKKIIVAEFVSLDGVMQAPGGAEEDTDGGFAYGGWTMPYWHDDMGATLLEEISQADTLLLGRKTWQTHAEAFEPAPADDPFAGLLNGLQKYVVSTTLKSADAWRNSKIISENVVEEVRKLKEQPGKDIYVDGSSVLVHTLAQADLVDEYSLLVFPIVLGSGKKVFPEDFYSGLKLVETKTFPSGVTLLRYQPDRK
ncbi:MAG TPA: dihydrofolate reductase family protein [Anaerolineales bacterium]|nr:dihydrofolate reductase family protein [Anaerolineales bacterium]